MLDFMPEKLSAWADKVDWLNNFITNVSVICTVGITLVMIAFAIIYRRKSDDDVTPNISHNARLETIWTLIPTIVVIYVFYFGLVYYQEMREPPSNAMEVNVKAWKWGWQFVYPNGKKSNELYLPVGKPARFIMSSDDVLHSFFIPATRVKEDIVPGRYSYMWFTPEKTGKFHIFCTEYCGTGHSKMISSLYVVTQQEFESFLIDRKPGGAPELSPQEQGAKIYKAQGCNVCHSIDGSKLIGPSFKGLFYRESVMEDGTTIKVDEQYFRESVMNPAAKIVKGYPNGMTPYEGRISDDELNNLIAYLKTLK